MGRGYPGPTPFVVAMDERVRHCGAFAAYPTSSSHTRRRPISLPFSLVGVIRLASGGQRRAGRQFPTRC